MTTPANKSERIFQGRVFNLKRITVPGPDNMPIIREVVEHPGGVTILPILDDQHIVMIRNHRYSIGRTLWELPAGTLEPPESPADCAARELIEETGYQAAFIKPMTSFYSSPGICDERLYFYAAYDLTQVGQQLDDSENITVEVVTWEKSMQMIRTGEIEDAKTVAAVLFYRTFEKGIA